MLDIKKPKMQVQSKRNQLQMHERGCYQVPEVMHSKQLMNFLMLLCKSELNLQQRMRVMESVFMETVLVQSKNNVLKAMEEELKEYNDVF